MSANITPSQSRPPHGEDGPGLSAHVGTVEEPAGQNRRSEPHYHTQRESVLVIDFGSQYSRLIARRVREANVYCELIEHTAEWDEVRHLNPKGVILSGGPASVYETGAPLAPSWVFDRDLPVLGICYGMQALVHQLGGQVEPSGKREFGHAILQQRGSDHPIFEGLSQSFPVWMSHGDRIVEQPSGFAAVAHTENSPIAATSNERNVIGIQFHPEVVHTPDGTRILENFVHSICGCGRNWNPSNFIEDAVDDIRSQVGDGKVICALSGGVDSAVAACLIHRAVGDQLTCIFVNNGFMRLEEPERIIDTFRRNMNVNIVHVDASDEFVDALSEVIDPEDKRRTVGEQFIKVFDREAARLGQVDFLAQGTLYPDVIESQTPGDNVSAKIKSHHNVGGLPEEMKLELVEPLRYLFKDEVRMVGLELGLAEEMVYRQPFPGPGLAIRVMGAVTREKLDTLRAADWIVMDEIKANGLYRDLWQSFAVLTDTMSVGVVGDFRAYGYVVAVRAVTSEEAMTADWARLPHDVLGRISSRIVNEVPSVSRVVYDITSKPPGTIEWE
ncbi:MAG: glutamine-hydrolyzing GMP synthase [Chloroflexi bacterium]|nr:glutamine-hydrolyzing GMP synthase [Chloroflexota bacterium]